jgi:hypothetical protein
MLAHQSFTLDPGNYHLNMGLKTLDRQKRAVHSDTIHIPDYSENRLQLSPLQFSIRIEKPDQVNPDLPFHGYHVYTYPMHSVVQKTPLYLYSEIYGLKQLTGGMSRYNIQCEIQPVEIEQNFTTMLSKLFNHYQYTPPFMYKAANQVDTNSDFIYTPLDLSKVPIGWNTIHLAVTDEVSGETFVRSQLFEVATAEDFQAAMQGITNRRERSQRFQPLPSRRSSMGRGRRGSR